MNGLLDFFKNNPVLIVVVLGGLWWLRQSPTPNPLLQSILEFLAKLLNVPMPASDQVDRLQEKLVHSHDMSTAEGVCCAVDDLCVELEKVGQKTASDALNAALPLLVKARRKPDAA